MARYVIKQVLWSVDIQVLAFFIFQVYCVFGNFHHTKLEETQRIKELAWKSEVRRWSGPSALDTSQTLWELYLKNWLCICQDSFGWKSQQATSNWERERERERGAHITGGRGFTPDLLNSLPISLLFFSPCTALSFSSFNGFSPRNGKREWPQISPLSIE